MTKKIYCDRKWHFTPNYEPGLINELMEDGEIVNLPHTVKETPFNYFDESEYQMISCYQKSLHAPVQWEGKVVYMVFEAIGHGSDIYINGKHVKHHNCGYTEIRIDVTHNLKYGEENLITVRVDSREELNQPPFGYVIDYMTYGGIYRDVYFEVKEEIHFKDVFLMPTLLERVSTNHRTAQQISMMKAQGILKSQCLISKSVFGLAVDERVFIKQYLDDKLLMSQPVGGMEEQTDGYLLEISSAPLTVKLWDVESPHLYTVTTQLVVDEEVADECVYNVGFRDSEFRAEGYYLNGRKLLLRGLNRHQSFPYVGYAMPESMQRYDAKILKEELCVNAVRTSHYPQSHYFIDECDKLGLLVFTEIPGWQHIGGRTWQDIAVNNTRDMVTQYRNHPSIILWGVRINESQDDDAFYSRTNEVAHQCDPTRPTGGVRAHAHSSLLEDVYTYNDFVHSGDNMGCQSKSDVTSDENKPYLISEFNGHMYPTKAYDDEEHRQAHAIRHARVLNDVAGEEDIAGCFGWCMFDYNTHKDFGSGDRICYHGVMDMFRNPKLAASVYSAFSETEPVLVTTSSFDIGEHPACNRGESYIITNADSVRMYKNDVLMKEYYPEHSKFGNLEHGPILIDDFVGDAIYDDDDFSMRQATIIKKVLNQVAVKGYKITPSLVFAAIKLIVFYKMKLTDAVPIYNKYVGDWGGESREYRFEAIKDDEVVKTVKKAACTKVHMGVTCSHTLLTELHTYDVAEIRIRAMDENDNQLYYFMEPVSFETEGPIEVIGPTTVAFKGGATGVYIKSIGEDGDGKLTIRCGNLEPVTIAVSVECLSK